MAKTKILYIGRRIMSDGETITHAFLQGKKEVFFRKARAVIIGYYYQAFTKENGLEMSAYPTQLDRADYPEEKFQAWHNDDSVAVAEQRRKATAKKLNRNPLIIAACERLKPLVAKLRYSDKRALVEYIIDELEREEREKNNRENNARIQKLLDRIHKRDALKTKKVLDNKSGPARRKK